MTIDLREWLYPLGFLAAFAFSSRMLIQWLSSEAKGKSYVTPLFWKLSLAGNILLAAHSFIQIQFHVCIIQVCNAVISWRNLNLMKPKTHQITTRQTCYLLITAIVITLTSFAWQNNFILSDIHNWFRIPTTPWQQHFQKPLHLSWHLFGFVGLALFSSRFWLQWWCAEKQQRSYLGPAFWWVSLTGESICLVYFLSIHDPVNFIGPAFALIPYIRNLILIRKNTHQLVEEKP